jgi:hypothetical protein
MELELEAMELALEVEEDIKFINNLFKISFY